MLLYRVGSGGCVGGWGGRVVVVGERSAASNVQAVLTIVPSTTRGMFAFAGFHDLVQVNVILRFCGL